jgi:hypothetical protein
MSKDITIASTTDTQEQVNLAAGLPAGAKPVEVEAGTGVGAGKVETPPAGEVDSKPKPVEEPPKPAEGEGKAKEGEGKTAEELAAEVKAKEEEGKEKGKGGFQKRIDKLTRRNYALEEQLEEQGRRVEQLLAHLEGKIAAAPVGVAPAVEAGKPTEEQFEGKPYSEYIEALSEWKADQRIKAALDKQTAEATKQAEEQRTKETFDAYNERVAVAHEKYPDFDEVVNREDVQIPQGVQLVVVELENGPAVAYYLGQHPEICRELCVLSPLAAVARAGVIAATLAAEEAEKGGEVSPPGGKPKVSSSAPPPIKPVGGASTKSAVPLDQLSYPDYRRVREQQEKERVH